MGTSGVNYHFSNLCGTVYRQGNLIYRPDGAKLLWVGTRRRDLDRRARSFTFPFEARRNIAHLARASTASSCSPSTTRATC